jgi:hypothetical protein
MRLVGWGCKDRKVGEGGFDERSCHRLRVRGTASSRRKIRFDSSWLYYIEYSALCGVKSRDYATWNTSRSRRFDLSSRNIPVSFLSCVEKLKDRLRPRKPPAST